MKIALDPFAYPPVREHEQDAGLDLRSPIGFVLEPKTAITIDTGVHIQIPKGCAGLLVSKSGLNVKFSATSTGLIDEGYSGSIVVKLYNHGNKEIEMPKGGKISQIVIIPVVIEPLEFVDAVVGGERGSNGFGSTGV